MREPLSLLEQSNAFKRLIRQRVLVNGTSQRSPVRSSLEETHDTSANLRTLSFDVYTSKHLATTKKSILPHVHRFDEVLLPSHDKNISRENNRHQRKGKRPFYRKSLFHSYRSSSTELDFAQLTARGTKPEFQAPAPAPRDNDTIINFYRHHAPPPSPSDDEIERILYNLDFLQNGIQSRASSRQSPMEKKGDIPFRLPKLHRSTRFQRTSSKDVRSTLSNYLQKYY